LKHATVLQSSSHIRNSCGVFCKNSFVFTANFYGIPDVILKVECGVIPCALYYACTIFIFGAELGWAFDHYVKK